MNKIIVLIPHYNNIDGLRSALKSIREPFPVDVMIVDDGSSEKPDEEIIKNIYTNGTVYIEYLKENSGISIAANHGLRAIEKMGYPLIARMDCGDICHPDKLYKQLKYLEENPEVKLLGAWANIKTPDEELLYVLKHPVSYETIKKKMYFNSMFIHPTLVFYTEILKTVGYYDEKKYARAAQDYAFLFKVIKNYRVENYPEALLDYYMDDNAISSKNRTLQVKNRIRIIWENFYFGYYPIVGLLRNIPLLFVSRKLSTSIKKRIKPAK